MHLQQTKTGSRASGGPQYYFHNVPDPVKEFLRKRGACPVVLQTPYGIARSPFMAVGRDHKLGKDGQIVEGSVGHDRIQQAAGNQSIGEAIRYWYDLRSGLDFEMIEVDVSIHAKGHFILIPMAVKMRSAARPAALERVHAPLSFHRDYQSKLWRQQIELARKASADKLKWAADQIQRVVADHHDPEQKSIMESDLLRTSGALSRLGLDLGAYLGKGYDCLGTQFRFCSFPVYPCPVEVKKRSQGFTYQVTRYTELPRVVVLCMEHNYVNPPEHVDFIELPALADCLSQ